jgi:two-component system response regulator FixJ
MRIFRSLWPAESLEEPAPGPPAAYIIDDDDDIAAALKLELSTSGYRCRSFATAIEFLRCVHKLEPGCLVLDIRMPGKNGIELLAELVEDDIRWPAVIMSAHGEACSAADAARVGAIAFLEKPFSGDALLAAVESGTARLRAAGAA